MTGDIILLPEIYRQFGSRLQAARLKAGLSQQDIATKLGIAQTTYSGYEQGTRKIPLKMITMFSLALNISADELIMGKTTNPPSQTPTEVGELSPDKIELLSDYDLLNDEGKLAARSAIKGLTYTPDYKKSFESEKMA